MKETVFEHLLELNKEFYQRFGAAFARTRRRIQPGVRRVLTDWIRDGDWLDIGCGGGALAQAWRAAGLRGAYTGIDFSPPLLTEAGMGLEAESPASELDIRFEQANLAEVGWEEKYARGGYDGVLAFAVLHHIPSSEYRSALLHRIAGLIKQGGLFIHSEWQFHNSPRLLARVQPWQMVGLTPAELEEGDTLLDWRYNGEDKALGSGLRYVHLFNREELARLAEGAGFDIIDEFESDGSGGRLGLYQVWRLKVSQV